MTSNGNSNGTKPPVEVVLQLSGGNDFMNTVIPYADPFYHEFRSTAGIADEDVLKVDDHFGFHPALTEISEMYSAGNVAIIAGIGYPEPDRSHFRSMDIWHTAEPSAVVAEGWLGRTIRELGPGKPKGCTRGSFGPGMARAMYLFGTPRLSGGHL